MPRRAARARVRQRPLRAGAVDDRRAARRRARREPRARPSRLSRRRVVSAPRRSSPARAHARSPRSTPRSSTTARSSSIARRRGRRASRSTSLFVSTGAAAGRSMAHPRTLIVAGDAAARRASSRRYVGAPATRYFTNAVTEVVVGDERVSITTRCSARAPTAFHVATHARARCRAARTFSSHSLALGGAARAQRRHRRARRRRRRLHAERPVSRRRRAARRQPHDDRSRHAALRRATSSTRASSTAARAAVFNGKIIVRPDAQKTDAKQTNQALLLSDDAHDQHQAAARDLRRRREVHARRDDRPARRGRDLLPARARPRRCARRATC